MSYNYNVNPTYNPQVQPVQPQLQQGYVNQSQQQNYNPVPVYDQSANNATSQYPQQQQHQQQQYNQNHVQQQQTYNPTSVPTPVPTPNQMQHRQSQQQSQQSQANNNQLGVQHHSHSLMRPPYVDPQTNIAYQCNDAENSGWLTKQSQWLKDWRRRYFLIKGSKLFFAKNEYSVPHGMIDLATCTTVKSADLKSRKIHSFEISTSEMTYLLYADSEKEKDDWIGFVGRAIVRSSTTFLDSKGDSTTNGSGGSDGGNRGGGSSNPWGVEGEDEVDYDELYEDENHPYFND